MRRRKRIAISAKHRICALSKLNFMRLITSYTSIYTPQNISLRNFLIMKKIISLQYRK